MSPFTHVFHSSVILSICSLERVLGLNSLSISEHRLDLCVCLCVCVCVHIVCGLVYMGAHVCILVCLYVDTCVYLCAYVCPYMCACVYVCLSFQKGPQLLISLAWAWQKSCLHHPSSPMRLLSCYPNFLRLKLAKDLTGISKEGACSRLSY